MMRCCVVMGVGHEYGIASRSRYFTDIGCKYGVPGLSLGADGIGNHHGRMAVLFCINGWRIDLDRNFYHKSDNLC
jgi:hypothetical protein